MQNESRSLSGIRTLLQHLCTKVTDRAEYRTKVAQVSTIGIQYTGMHTSHWLTHHLNMWISKTFEVDKYFCYCLLIYPKVLHNPRDTETFYFPCFAFAPFIFSSSHTFNFCSLNIQYAFIDCSAFANSSEFFLHCYWELMYVVKRSSINDLQQLHVDVNRYFLFRLWSIFCRRCPVVPMVKWWNGFIASPSMQRYRCMYGNGEYFLCF